MKMKLRQRYHLFIFFLEALQISFDFLKKDFFFSSIKTTHPKGDLSYFAVRSEFSFGGNALCAMQTTLAHVFTSEGKHLGSENANGCVESCSEGRGEYHACLTREISLYPPSKLSCNRFYYVSNAFTDIF